MPGDVQDCNQANLRIEMRKPLNPKPGFL